MTLKRTGMAVLLAASAAVSAAACGGGSSARRVVVVQPPAQAMVGGERTPVVVSNSDDADRNPNLVAARIRERADEVVDDVRRDVDRGRVPASAMTIVNERRRYLEQLISQYSADGVIQREEGRHLERQVDRLREQGERIEDARGGGPMYWSP